VRAAPIPQSWQLKVTGWTGLSPDMVGNLGMSRLTIGEEMEA
jgi:hypothetical protein